MGRRWGVEWSGKVDLNRVQNGWAWECRVQWGKRMARLALAGLGRAGEVVVRVEVWVAATWQRAGVRRPWGVPARCLPAAPTRGRCTLHPAAHGLTRCAVTGVPRAQHAHDDWGRVLRTTAERARFVVDGARQVLGVASTATLSSKAAHGGQVEGGRTCAGTGLRGTVSCPRERLLAWCGSDASQGRGRGSAAGRKAEVWLCVAIHGRGCARRWSVWRSWKQQAQMQTQKMGARAACSPCNLG